MSNPPTDSGTPQEYTDDELKELFRYAAGMLPLPERLRQPIPLPERTFTERDLRRRTWVAGLGATLAASVVFGIIGWLLWPRLPASGTSGDEVPKEAQGKEPRVMYCERISGYEEEQAITRGSVSVGAAGGVIPIVVSAQASQGWVYHLSLSRADKVGSLSSERPDLLRGSVRTTWAESGRHRIVVILGGTDDTASQVAQSLGAWLTPEDREHLADLPTGPEGDASVRDYIAKVLRDNGWTGSASEIVVALSFQVVTTE